MDNMMPNNPTLLITGAAKRLGAETARTFHNNGYNVALHYRQSKAPAQVLADELNSIRANSCEIFMADLDQLNEIEKLATDAVQRFGRIDTLINNASSFYPTKIGSATEQHWNDLISSNMKAPFFLSQACAPHLQAAKGCIINIVDIYSEKALANHTIYCMAKAGLNMMTQSLALELAPNIRVNGISPGAILWPSEGDSAMPDQTAILAKVPLARTGEASDIANTALFLATNAPYISGQVIPVDGGRTAGA
jgi:pteridine reductase|tara:strand:- start:4221 stop:4973 length:753 start_codon:yes stop_codon:yes gene_type:complete